MREGSGMQEFSSLYPDRYFDVGIAEQHAVTFAAGLACDKQIRPVVAIYSTFLQRAYDQLIHDVALQNLPVLFAIDRAGLVGADGATHAGAYDLSYLRCIPNMTVMVPKDELECRIMLNTGLNHSGPCAVRYPRGSGPGVEVNRKISIKNLQIGKAEICRKKKNKSGISVVFLAFGSMVEECMQVAEKIDSTVVNMRFIKPLDVEIIKEMMSLHEVIVTVEENVIMGGAGSACNEVIIAEKSGIGAPKHKFSRVLNIGLPDRYIDHGTPKELLIEEGLSADGIFKKVESLLKKLNN